MKMTIKKASRNNVLETSKFTRGTTQIAAVTAAPSDSNKSYLLTQAYGKSLLGVIFRFSGSEVIGIQMYNRRLAPSADSLWIV